MSNPQDIGTFDRWLSDRLYFTDIAGKGTTRSTSLFDQWFTDRIYFQDIQSRTTEFDQTVGGALTFVGTLSVEKALDDPTTGHVAVKAYKVEINPDGYDASVGVKAYRTRIKMRMS